MADEIKKIYARIGGMSYHLVTAENEPYTRQIAAKADEMINRVMQNNPQLSQNMSTVLALVNAVDELNGMYQRQSSVDNQKNEMEKQTGEARKELMRLREQNWEMKKEVLRLNDLCKEYQSLINKLTTPDETKTPGIPDADTDTNADIAPVVLTFDGEDNEGDGDDTSELAPFHDAGINPEQIPATSATSPVSPASTTSPDQQTMITPENDETEPGAADDQSISPQTIDQIMSRAGKKSDAPVGEMRQTNLDDYLRATGWPQVYETKKHEP